MAEETVICRYLVRPDREDEFRELLARHWPTLHELGTVTDQPAIAYRSLAEPPTYVEIFTWAEGGFQRAHEHPRVIAIWEPMELCLEDRGELPKWEFLHFRQVATT
ncbi:MAG: hypothetical protein WD271_03685 [Acidimicrobiia bacterium]